MNFKSIHAGRAMSRQAVTVRISYSYCTMHSWDVSVQGLYNVDFYSVIRLCVIRLQIGDDASAAGVEASAALPAAAVGKAWICQHLVNRRVCMCICCQAADSVMYSAALLPA